MSKERFSRQSFLDSDSEASIVRCTVGVAGLGGGGSHIIQLAHIGFQRFVIYDGDVVDDSNLNRQVGATSVDVAAETPNLYLAKRMIFGLQPHAHLRGFAWEVARQRVSI
jgi:molybdopterin/thiamine biosynthesis adenylyltransferase